MILDWLYSLGMTPGLACMFGITCALLCLLAVPESFGNE